MAYHAWLRCGAHSRGLLTVDALILAIVIHVLEAAEDLDGRDVASSFVDNAFRAVCNKVLKEDQRLFSK